MAPLEGRGLQSRPPVSSRVAQPLAHYTTASRVPAGSVFSSFPNLKQEPARANYYRRSCIVSVRWSVWLARPGRALASVRIFITLCRRPSTVTACTCAIDGLNESTVRAHKPTERMGPRPGHSTTRPETCSPLRPCRPRTIYQCRSSTSWVESDVFGHRPPAAVPMPRGRKPMKESFKGALQGWLPFLPASPIVARRRGNEPWRRQP